jgi:hypothetical protein
MNYYKTIEFCPAINFLKYDDTGDVRFLLKDIDFERLPDITQELTGELVEIGKEMAIECVNVELSEVGKNQIIYSTKKSIAEKQIAYHQVINICNYINAFGVDDFSKQELKRYGYNIADDCDIYARLRQIIATNENKRLFIAEEETELKTVAGEGEKTSYQKIAQLIEKHLNRDIDLHKISMQKFILLKIDTIKAIEKWQQNKK